MKQYKAIPACTGAGFKLAQGHTLEVLTPFGSQVSDFFCVSADLKSYFSALRTIDYAESIRLKVGDKFYSQDSQELAVLVEDTCRVHDLLMPPCSLAMYRLVAENPKLEHPSCQSNLQKALLPFGVDEKMLHCSFNIFMNVPVSSSGKVEILKPQAQAGDFIKIKALQDLIVGLTACPHPETNGHEGLEIHYSIT